MAAGKKKGLGRGLDALFADQVSVNEKDRGEAAGNAVIDIDINDIKPNKNQPRKVFDDDKIEELADSITTHGVIQPLVVRKSGKNYEIVAGERRWRAARKAGLATVPCITKELTEEENMVIAIIENMQREDLNPIEEAEGLEQMIKTYGFTQDKVSKSVSKSRPYITNALRLLKLPKEAREMVAEGKITAGHARALISVKSKEKQLALCKKIVNEGLSVRQVENLVKEGDKPRKKPLKRVKHPDTLLAERELKDIYGTRVTINQKGNKGTIELEYYSDEELNRLIDLLKSN